ncbi:MAG: MBL fold metallo-hydrolase [Actinomycetota bacterium]|nr:MBL fold metallo-hydrolase [Actinomycetota bacterium]
MSSLRLCALSSGSSGNATYIESESGGLLIDAGLSCRRIKKLLASIGRSLDDLEAVLLTHGHTDHTSGLRSLVRECGLRVVSAPGVGEHLGSEVVEAGESFLAGGIEARFFAVPHDAPTYGVRLDRGGLSAVVATDFGEAAPDVLEEMLGADAVVLEANHDEDWLWSGPYPAHLKRRIAAPNGHLSNEQAAEAALALAPHGLKDIVLGHLSEKNNSAARAVGKVKAALRGGGFDGIRVRAAMARRPTPWIEVGEPTADIRPNPDEARLFGA